MPERQDARIPVTEARGKEEVAMWKVELGPGLH